MGVLQRAQEPGACATARPSFAQTLALRLVQVNLVCMEVLAEVYSFNTLVIGV